MTVLMSSMCTPGTASRHRLTSRTTSRWISRSASKASASMVTLTEPSMAFSMGTKPEVDLARLDGGQHVGDRGQGDQLAGARDRAG